MIYLSERDRRTIDLQTEAIFVMGMNGLGSQLVVALSTDPMRDEERRLSSWTK